MGFRSINPDHIPTRHPVAVVRDWWRGTGNGSIAPWSCFDPVDHAGALPWVMLLRQEKPGDAELLRYVVCGDGCRQAFGFSYQGKLFGEDLPADAFARRQAEFAQVRAGLGPLFSTTPLPLSDREFIEVYRGVFGFASEDTTVDRYLVVLAPVNVRVPALPSAVAWRGPFVGQGLKGHG